ncbi:MAG: zinc ABC transporter substrate-binding protein [Gammaproteobacteria bacterium]|nr:zinc ABC transporter substrate-binding protein [Gammaproteobacteria bacterium]MCI0591793.1 zinc ABC transporter substrate-binding protein [Gammaproteobacteria bacterium]
MKHTAALVLLLVFQFGSAGVAVAADLSPIVVFVSVLPQKYFVERIGGDRVHVSVMVGPGQTPELYEPTAKQMVRMANAQVYFRLGIPFEEVWMGRIAATNQDMLIVNCREGIPIRPTHLINGSRSNVTTIHEERDPHVWTSPPLMRIMAAHIKDTLVALDPTHREEFETNYTRLDHELDDLDREIRTLFANVTTRRFMVFHPAWDYFADTYGLEQIAIENEGKEPGAKSLANAIDQAEAEDISVIFVQKQISATTAQAVAHATGAHIVQIDPLAEDYLENMRFVAKTFADAMR